MKKKLLSLLLASAMAMSVCACGNAEGKESVVSNETIGVVSSETGSSETISTDAEPYVPTYPIVEDKITITALLVGEDTSLSETRIVWDEVEELTNIHIEWQNIDIDSYATYLASGEWPDLIAHSMAQTSINDYGVTGGKFVNYLDYLDIMPNFKKAIEDYPAALAYATQMNGAVYNLFRINGDQSTNCYCRTHYRMDVLNAAGITEPPATIEEFYDCLVTLKDFYGEPSYIHNNNVQSGWNPSLYGAFGTLTQMNLADDGTGKVVFARTTEQMKLYYKFMHKLYDEGLMHPEYLTLDNAAIVALIQTGKVAFFPQSPAQKITADDLNGNWDSLGTLAPFTSEYDSTQEIVGYPDYNQDAGMFINAESEYVEEICKMLDIMYATEEVVEGSNLCGVNFGNGPEFISWVDNGDGTYTELAPEGYKNKSEYVNKAYRWTSVGRNDRMAGLITSTPGNAQVRSKGYVENIIPYQSDRYVYEKGLKFTEDEQYVIDNKYGEIQNYIKQMEAEFISGASDIDEKWDEYVKTFEKMGIAEVLEVYQAAYDRFNEAMAVASK